MCSSKTNQAEHMKRKMYEMGLWVLASQAPFPSVFQTSSQFILVCRRLKMAMSSLTPPALSGGLCPFSFNLGSLRKTILMNRMLGKGFCAALWDQALRDWNTCSWSPGSYDVSSPHPCGRDTTERAQNNWQRERCWLTPAFQPPPLGD